MKTTLLFLSVFLSVSLFGQNVYIPDANFKAHLVGNSAINTNSDTEIQVSEASAFDGGIICESLSIWDLTGIEAFTALDSLNCSSNWIQSFLIDISQNTALTYLNYANNALGNLDISQNTALTYLNCENTGTSNLDVSQMTALQRLDCEGNQLTNLDLTQNIALTYLDCEGNQLTNLDLTQNIALTYLNLSDNGSLSSFDLTQNIALTYLDCAITGLTNLDISQNTALTTLSCWLNNLTSLDVAQNTALTSLSCFSNDIQSLDVSQNIALTSLDCENNILTCLNVQNGNNHNFTYIDIGNNSWLTCIEVDDVAYSTANWTNIPAILFSTNCNNDCSTSTAGINELNTSKTLIQILDLMGREVTFKPNTPLIYVYDDGSTERVFSVEY